MTYKVYVECYTDIVEDCIYNLQHNIDYITGLVLGNNLSESDRIILKYATYKDVNRAQAAINDIKATLSELESRVDIVSAKLDKCSDKVVHIFGPKDN